MGYEKGEHFAFCVKPIVRFASGLTASHLKYLVSAHLDHLLYALLSKQSLAKFLQGFSNHFGTFPVITKRSI